MPRPALVGWWHFAKRVQHDVKQSGIVFVWRKRRRMYKQMIRKRYFWMTPDERVAAAEKALVGLREIGKTLWPNGRPESEDDW